MPEQESGEPAKSAPEPAPEQPQKIEIIPLEPKRIIKRSDDPLPLEKRDSSGSGGSGKS
jgi:hypothetical protein